MHFLMLEVSVDIVDVTIRRNETSLSSNATDP